MLAVLCVTSLYMVWQPVLASDNKFPTQGKNRELLSCPKGLLPPLYPVGPLCVAEGVKVVQHGDIVALTWWNMPLVEGPASDVWFAHVFIREGEWRILELSGQNHGCGDWSLSGGHSHEITVMFWDTCEWHPLGAKLWPGRYEHVFLQYPNFPVWAGCEVGVIFRGISRCDDLRMSLTLQRVATDVDGGG